MKRFAITVLSVAVFFVGLGALVDNVGAKFKSDEKALDLVRKARVAIGGDAAIASVQSLRIVGQTTRTVKFDGVERSEQGETEIALQFPDKLMKSMKIGSGDGTDLMETRLDHKVDVVVVGEAKPGQKMTVVADGNGNGAVARKIIIRKDDGTVQELTGDEAAKFVAKADHATPGAPGVHTITLKKKADGSVEQIGGEAGQHIFMRKADGTGGTATFTSKDGKTFNIDGKDVVMERAVAAGHAGGMKDNELLRTTLSLLLTAPQGMDVAYTYGGEGSVDGTSCDIVVASFAGASYKLYLSRSSSMPVMMSYTGHKAPMIFAATTAPKAGEEPKGNVMFTRAIPAVELAPAEFNVKFSDFRSTGGVQLPYKWTRTIGGAADETFDVTNYEINPANIAEKFNNQTVKVRMTKPDHK